MQSYSVMINRYPFVAVLATLLALLPSLLSCDKRVDTAEQWRIANEKAFAEYADSTNFKKTTVEWSSAYVFMKKTHTVEKGEYPIETSRVLIHYEAYQITGDKGRVDGNYESESPALFSLSRGTKTDLISGMRIGLQNMLQGEEAVIIIPWHLAYGSTRMGNVPAYTAFRYTVRLDSIIPESVL